jgi:peptide/nickel transport system substrate-binding protein
VFLRDLGIEPADELPEAERKKLYARDLEGAKRLMQEAGMASGFDLKVSAPNYLASAYQAEAELIQSYLKDINVRMSLGVVDGATITARQASGQFEAIVIATSIAATNGDLYSRFYTGGGQNYRGYDNPDLNKLIDQQAVLSRDPEARKKLVLDIQRTTIDDAILLCTMDRQQPIITAPEIRDFYPVGEMLQTPLYWSTAWINK